MAANNRDVSELFVCGEETILINLALMLQSVAKVQHCPLRQNEGTLSLLSILVFPISELVWRQLHSIVGMLCCLTFYSLM